MNVRIAMDDVACLRPATSTARLWHPTSPVSLRPPVGHGQLGVPGMEEHRHTTEEATYGERYRYPEPLCSQDTCEKHDPDRCQADQDKRVADCELHVAQGRHNFSCTPPAVGPGFLLDIIMKGEILTRSTAAWTRKRKWQSQLRVSSSTMAAPAHAPALLCAALIEDPYAVGRATCSILLRTSPLVPSMV